MVGRPVRKVKAGECAGVEAVEILDLGALVVQLISGRIQAQAAADPSAMEAKYARLNGQLSGNKGGKGGGTTTDPTTPGSGGSDSGGSGSDSGGGGSDPDPDAGDGME